MTATCQYCHATLPRHVSLAKHYATCVVLAYCFGPEVRRRGGYRISEVEKASRSNEQHEISRARDRRKVPKHH